MKSRLVAVAAALLATATAVRAAEDPLKVCLDENLPPLSMHQRGKPDSGFDVALAQAVAERLGRPLKIQWFESKLDESSSPALEANALLSDGRCALVGSYVFTKDSLVVPRRQDGEAAGFRGRHPRRPPPPRAGRRACTEPALCLLAADRRARREGARPQSLRRRRSCRAAHRDRKRHAWRRDPDDFRKRTVDRQHHASGSGAGRLARRAQSRRLRRDIARPAPPRCLSRRPSRYQARRIRILLSDRRQLGAMSASPAIRLSSSLSTRRSPICRRQEP